jgi:hypothetical protein
MAVSLGSIFSATDACRTVTTITCGRCSVGETRRIASRGLTSDARVHRQLREEAS